MALGGGTFLVQNKVLPGSYINFISAARASAVLSDRGVATMPLTKARMIGRGGMWTRYIAGFLKPRWT